MINWPIQSNSLWEILPSTESENGVGCAAFGGQSDDGNQDMGFAGIVTLENVTRYATSESQVAERASDSIGRKTSGYTHSDTQWKVLDIALLHTRVNGNGTDVALKNIKINSIKTFEIKDEFQKSSTWYPKQIAGITKKTSVQLSGWCLMGPGT